MLLEIDTSSLKLRPYSKQQPTTFGRCFVYFEKVAGLLSNVFPPRATVSRNRSRLLFVFNQSGKDQSKTKHILVETNVSRRNRAWTIFLLGKTTILKPKQTPDIRRSV